MIECKFCQATYVANTLFCSECGEYLLEDDKQETELLITDRLGWLGDTTGDSEIASSLFQQNSEPMTIRLKMGTGKRAIEISLDKVIQLGRMDPTLSILPEVDLTGDDVIDKGISRRHARILKEQNKVVVEDLGSINGTFINGKRVAPFLPENLNDGDTLQLGKLLIKIKIQNARPGA